MKKLSPTQACSDLQRWLDRALAGECIGIKHKGRIIKLQPVPVAEDWASAEYGLTRAELDRAAANLLASGKKLLASGTAVPWPHFNTSRKGK